MKEIDFEKVERVFCIEVFDYVTNEVYVSKAEYSSYEEAQKAIPSLTAPSHCCGFSIVSMPKLNLEHNNADIKE